MQWHRGEYTIDTDRARLPLETILRWLRTAYWAETRPPERIQRSWENAAVVFGLYHKEEIVGWARVVTDCVTVAYLADVFLLLDHRGRGLGRWLVETVVAHPDLATVGWLLHTRDAHDLYRQVGVTTGGGPRLMQRLRPEP